MNHTFFSKIDSEIKAYLLGFYVGDGSVSIRKNRHEYSLKFSQAEKDSEIIYLIQEHIGNKNIWTRRKGTCFNYQCQDQKIICYYSKQLVVDLISLGYGLKKTYRNLHLPQIEKELIIHFIRGYFDADGTCGVYETKRKDRKTTRIKPTFHITSNTQTLLNEIQSFLLEYNITIPLYYTKKGYWELKSGSVNSVKNLYKLLYNNSTYYIRRKHEKFSKVMLTSREFRELKISEPCNA